MPAVNQTLGIPEADFLKLGAVGRDNPTASNRAIRRETPWRRTRIASRFQHRRLCAGARGRGRQFGALVALADINLRIGAGERRAVLGSNGAGKTTLFNAVTGDFPPTAGRIRFFGEDVTRFRCTNGSGAACAGPIRSASFSAA